MSRKSKVLLLTLIVILSFGISTEAAENKWNILSGFGSVKATGTGTSVEEDGSLTFNGYGALTYELQKVQEAVAIQFEIQAYPSSSHYFYFGLLDDKNEAWDVATSKVQGIISEVVVTNSGKVLKMLAMSKSDTGTITINTGASELKAIDMQHMLTMHKEAGSWIYTLDGVEIAKVPVSSIHLDNSANLVAGAFGSSSMEMTVKNVYIDDEVTNEMKDGTYIKEIAGDAGKIKVYYDDEGKLIMGDATKSSVLSYEKPAYVVTDTKQDNNDSIWLMIALGSGAMITLIFSVVMIQKERKREVG